MLVLEACLRGDFLDRKFGFGEQAAGADDAEFQQILVRTQTGMRSERAAEPTVTDAQFLRQTFHVQLARVSILDAGDGEFNGVRVLRFGGRLGLLRGVKQAQQVGGCPSKNLLQRRAVCPHGLHHAAEGGQHGVLGIDFQDGMFFGDEPVLEPAAGNFAIETDPMFMPASFGVWRVAVPDSGK